MKHKALQIYLSGINHVLPDKLVRAKLLKEGAFLTNIENTYVLSFGKAAYLMAKAAEEMLDDRITDGLVVTKYGHGGKLKHLKLIESGHPAPDENGVEATKQAIEIANKAKENDLVICLISGGASSLLADYPEDSSLDDLRSANDQLVNSGANILEINSVRKHLSGIKGGQLAKAIYPATTLSLILSDVVGDKLDVIASGITAPDETTFKDALDVIKKYNLEKSFPKTLLNHLVNGNSGAIPETPKLGDPIFDLVQNNIIGNNKIALEGAATKAKELGFETQIITDKLEGDFSHAAELIINTINKYNQNRPACLLFGGEPTVNVTDLGLGGRNQHLALYLATKIKGNKNVTILCAGTDGNDGPTDSAGAIVDGNTIEDAKENDLNPNEFLIEFNSYNFFKHNGDSIKIGNSGTNVMDLIVVLLN